jgi:F-type H+-transporting ATPase subunit b
MGLLIPEIGLLFWMLLSFGVVLFALVRWGFPMVLRAVYGRREQIAASLEKADRAERRAAELDAQAEGIVEQARREGGTVIAQAREQGAAIVEGAQRSAREQTLRSLEQAADEAAEANGQADNVLHISDFRCSHLDGNRPPFCNKCEPRTSIRWRGVRICFFAV